MNPIVSAIQGVFESSDSRFQWERLSSILELEVGTVRKLAGDRRLSYHRYQIKKRNGGKRPISAPNNFLKQLQRRLCRHYLNDLPIHQACHSFRKRHSVKTHARAHVGQEIIVTCDLKDFFTSTTTKRVRKFFGHQGWTGEPLNALMRLTCYRGGLPQGAPTSPVLSNLVNFDMDVRLLEAATHHQARYSRYCDDLAFSWSVEENSPCFQPAVEGIIDQFGYQIQADKGWKSQRQSEVPELTGVAIRNYQLLPSRELHHKRDRLVVAAKRNPKLIPKLVGLQGFWKFLKRY